MQDKRKIGSSHLGAFSVFEEKNDIFPSNLKNGKCNIVAHSIFKKVSYIPREIIRIHSHGSPIIRILLFIIATIKNELHDSCAYHGCINVKWSTFHCLFLCLCWWKYRHRWIVVYNLCRSDDQITINKIEYIIIIH